MTTPTPTIRIVLDIFENGEWKTRDFEYSTETLDQALARLRARFGQENVVIPGQSRWISDKPGNTMKMRAFLDGFAARIAPPEGE